MCILSTLSALNSIENYYYHIEFRMDSMYIGTQAMNLEGLTLRSRVSLANQIIQRNQWNLIPKRMIQSRFFNFFYQWIKTQSTAWPLYDPISEWMTLMNRFFLVNLNTCESFETVI